MDRLAASEIFVRVVDTGSFSAVARGSTYRTAGRVEAWHLAGTHCQLRSCFDGCEHDYDVAG
jgi:hypothetical protein